MNARKYIERENMRFLVFGGPGIGDTIIELAFAKALKGIYPNSKIDLIISDSLNSSNTILELLECQEYIETCWIYSRKKLLQFFKMMVKLKMNKYDYGFSCTTSFKATALPSRICRLIGCKSIIKYVNGKTGHIDYPIQINEELHILDQYGELLKVLQKNCTLDILVLNQERIKEIIRINNKTHKIVTICLGTNITIFLKNGKKYEKNIKDWYLENWILLSKKLINRKIKVIFIGGKNQLNQLDQLNMNMKNYLKNKINNYVGKTSIKESLSIIYQSDLIIGADTGMMHCAAALNKKTLTLFGGTNPNVWKPYGQNSEIIWGKTDCSPCYGKDFAINCNIRKCTNLITVDEVYNKVLECLGEKNDIN